MSRSWKRPFYKDVGLKDLYWKLIRRRTKIAVKQGQEILPHPKELMNDYDYSDYSWIFEPDDEYAYWNKLKTKIRK